jgi:hypothetical protein
MRCRSFSESDQSNAAMGRAFQEACDLVERSERAEMSREVLASKIIDLARGGETDPVVLPEMVLSELGLSRAQEEC